MHVRGLRKRRRLAEERVIRIVPSGTLPLDLVLEGRLDLVRQNGPLRVVQGDIHRLRFAQLL